jgi:type II secretory pathway component HofQ
MTGALGGAAMKTAFAVCLTLLCILNSNALTAENDRDAVRHVEYITEKKDQRDTTITLTQTTQRPLKQVLDYLSTVSGMNISVQSEELKKLLVDVDFGTAARPTPWHDVLDNICRTYTLRLNETQLKEKIVRVYKPELISVTYRDADVRDAIFEIANVGKLNVIVDPEIQGKVTATLKDMPCTDALEMIVKSLGYVMVVTENGSTRLKTK